MNDSINVLNRALEDFQKAVEDILLGEGFIEFVDGEKKITSKGVKFLIYLIILREHFKYRSD